MKIALAGNPNCGKTTLFNALTGATAHVGNWPGVTVEKREGKYKKGNVYIVDLPGIYSLSPYTPEEVVSRNFILNENPDCVINIVDATNIERNLYLTTQILEMNIPVVIALNMADLVNAQGTEIDIEGLSKAFGVPVVLISALKKQGLVELIEAAKQAAATKREGSSVLSGNKNLKETITVIENALIAKEVKDPLFHAVKLIENDELDVETYKDLKPQVDEAKAKYTDKLFGSDYEALIANERYNVITKNLKGIVKKVEAPKDEKAKVSKSDKIDKVLTHRIWGIPLFLVLMFVIFHFVFSEDFLGLNLIFKLEIHNEGAINFFTGMGYEGMLEEAGGVVEDVFLEGIPSLGVFLQSWMGFLTGKLIDLFASFMPEGTWYTGLVCDGLLTGLDAIFSFLPQVLLLFLFISILEDSGYMARVAFIMDRAFRKFGLSGKAFIPLLMGFGCSVPSMMATKTLESEKERDTTIRYSPYFSCGAKQPIWIMLAAVIGGTLGSLFVFLIYLLGMVVAIVAALFTKLFSKNYEVPPFIMELPAYHLPQFGNLMAHLWEKFKHFVIKASTIIAASTVIIWFLSNFSWAFWNGLVENIDESMLADLGHVFSYFFYPLGWAQGADGWKYTVSTITGLIAKEDVIATMAELGLEEGTVALTNSQIFSFAAYNLFTFPCFAAIATAKSESSKKGFWITMATWFGLSYVVALVIYGIGAAFEFHWALGLVIDLLIIGGIVAAGILLARRTKKANTVVENN